MIVDRGFDLAPQGSIARQNQLKILTFAFQASCSLDQNELAFLLGEPAHAHESSV